MPASFSAPLNPETPPPPTPTTNTTPSSGSGGGADPSAPSDPSPVADPNAPTYSGSGQSDGNGPSGSGSGQSGGAGGGDAAGSGATGGGEDGSSGNTGGQESVWWVGKGEPGQLNEFAGELHNIWMRVDRIPDSYTPPFYGTQYGRFDLRYNGYDAVLYATVYDNGGNHRADTLLDFANGTLTTWHGDTLTSTDNKGWWYLGTAADQRFLSLDGRDASLWVYNGIDDYQFLVGLGRMTITNGDYTRYGSINCGDGSLYLYNEVHTYLMKSGVVSASNADYTRYASLNGSDGTLFIFNEERHYVMKEGRIVASNADSTRYAAIDSNDGSLFIYNELHQYVFNGGRVMAADSDYAHFAALDGGKGELYLYDPSYTYVMKEGRMAISNAEGTSYVAADAHDGSLWAYDSSSNNFLYRGGYLKIYSDATGQSAELGMYEGSQVLLIDSLATAKLRARSGDCSLILDNNGFNGLSYASDGDVLSVYSGSMVGSLTPYALTLNNGSSSGTYEPSAITLSSGGGTVYIDAGAVSGTASFQSVDVCVGGTTKSCQVLMTTPS